MGNTYSVPSRLIGTHILIRVRAETLEGYVGTSHAFSLPRLIGKHQHRINYQHIIWSLVRKPGAFGGCLHNPPKRCIRLHLDISFVHIDMMG